MPLQKQGHRANKFAWVRPYKTHRILLGRLVILSAARDNFRAPCILGAFNVADPKQKQSSVTPIIGFLIAVALGVGAWLVAPSAITALTKTLPSLNTLTPMTARIIFTVIIVVMALIIFGLVAALTTQKRDPLTNESRLEKERDAMRREQKNIRAQRRKR